MPMGSWVKGGNDVRQPREGMILLVSQFCYGAAFTQRRPTPIRLWYRQVEVGARTLRLQAGRRFSVTCDGIQPTGSAGPRHDPRLTWFGPDRNAIQHEGRNSRISIERPQSRWFQKLHFRTLRASDSGRYICAGWFGRRWGWYQRYVDIVVVGVNTTPAPTNTTSPVPTTRTTIRLPTTLRTAITEVQTPPPAALQNTTNRTGNCTSPNFLCVRSGECFAGRYRCDGFPDCDDGTDENNCEGSQCQEGQFSCADGSGCVPSELTCNNDPDCPDGSDETSSICR